jgi:hypothetical protein
MAATVVGSQAIAAESDYDTQLDGGVVNVNYSDNDSSVQERIARVPLEAIDIGTLVTKTITVTNTLPTTGYSAIPVPISFSECTATVAGSGAANVTVESLTPTAFILGPGESADVTVKAGVKTSAPAGAAAPRVDISCGRVVPAFDQVWRDSDYDFVSNLGSVTILTSEITDAAELHVESVSIVPGDAFRYFVSVTNDLSYPVSVTFLGYGDTGELAPYITGTLRVWTDVVLEPGETADLTQAVIGMPWWINNDSMDLYGDAWWDWKVETLPTEECPPGSDECPGTPDDSDDPESDDPASGDESDDPESAGEPGTENPPNGAPTGGELVSRDAVWVLAPLLGGCLVRVARRRESVALLG